MAAASRKKYAWASLPQEELLEVRMCDLDLSFEGTWLDAAFRQIQQELARRDLRVRPHFWLSDEWFSPSGVPGVGVPFYLAHPRLMKLERSIMLEVEGGSYGDAVKILRHEVGHAVDHAYRLSRKRRWQQLFGLSSQHYPSYYRPNPASKRYVQHLDYWYAQAHPDEDFAETFAVWLEPRSQWRKRYQGWPALRKLRYVDKTMRDLAGERPVVRSRRRIDPLERIKKTLREHYGQKRDKYGGTYPDVYDLELTRLFSDDPRHAARESAASFLRRNREEIRQLVSRWTGEYEFTLDQVFREMIERSTVLRLRAVGSERQLKLDFAILLTAKTMHHLYSQRHWLPL